MKLHLHGSVTFWSGLLVMGFVCWAWRDSVLKWSSLTYRGWRMVHLESGVVLAWQEYDSGTMHWSRTPPYRTPSQGKVRFTRLRFLRKAEAEGEMVCRERYHRAYSGRGDDPAGCLPMVFASTFNGTPGDWTCYLPHWLILLALALPWSALLFLRGRGRRRSTGERSASTQSSKATIVRDTSPDTYLNQ